MGILSRRRICEAHHPIASQEPDFTAHGVSL